LFDSKYRICYSNLR